MFIQDREDSMIEKYIFLEWSVNVLQSGRGKIAVLGYAHMLSDQYLDKEENSKIMVFIHIEIQLYLNIDLLINVLNKHTKSNKDYGENIYK